MNVESRDSKSSIDSCVTCINEQVSNTTSGPEIHKRCIAVSLICIAIVLTISAIVFIIAIMVTVRKND